MIGCLYAKASICLWNEFLNGVFTCKLNRNRDLRVAIKPVNFDRTFGGWATLIGIGVCFDLN